LAASVNALRNLDAGDDRAETERQHDRFRFGDVNRSLVVVGACSFEDCEVSDRAGKPDRLGRLTSLSNG
jgi:hypothetical protein